MIKVVHLLVLGLAITLGSCDRTKEKIYENVYGSMCFRRLNATHQTGCTSAGKSSGSVGVLHLIQDESDFDFLLQKPPAPPYAAIVTPRHFTRENILKLRDSEFVSAIVLINDTRGMDHFSQESKCPNQLFRHDKQPMCDVAKLETTWNPFGTGLLQENFDIPIIFLSNKNESEKVLKCYEDFNKDIESQAQSSLCSIEINSFMSAAGNSEICMRRTEIFKVLNQVHYCDPLQGKNIYATLFPRQVVEPENRTTETNEKFILISARLDTTSMFDGLGLGALDSLASVATLFTTGHFLRKIIATNEVYEKNNVNVLFMLFNGESYDYIGSQRFVYDLKKGDAFPSPSSYTKPLSLDNIMMMIDIGSLDSLTDLKFYQLAETNMSKKFVESIDYYKKQLKIDDINVSSSVTNNLPPVSAQSFLRENSTFPAFIVGSGIPENKFYHSVYDDASNLNFTYYNTSKNFDDLPNALDASDFPNTSVQTRIQNIATLIALGIYDVLNDDHKYNQNQVASAAFVDEFLYCYLRATKCRLFESIFEFQGSYRGNDFPPQRYISVQASVTLEATGWAHRVFGFVLSQKVPSTKENCTTLPMFWMPGSAMTGECRLTTQNFSLALSPAFEEVGYNFKSNKYSTWTESTWNELSARIFLRPSATHESLTFSVGFVVMIISFVIVYLISSKTDVLFADVAVEHVSLPAQC